ncbi:type II toxin-antitoxin system VapC family toxin [Saccharibacillus brassicae]|uniref:type II toxin-antitoxin system VapC family toxin n=1 Tax=Saccharibacillus brassicae TaxID=2583377 RepID=UPI00147864BF|nr:PIN domain-containing protein [Saccharibacillus brassicae]
MNYLFDTNAAIELSKVYKEPYENEVQSLFGKLLVQGSLVFYSVITQAEFLSGKSKVNNIDFVNYFELEEAEEFLSVTPIIAKTAGNLRDKLSTMDQPIKIKMPDALILATAITHDLVLVTADADFRFSKILGVETFIFKPAAGIEGI